MGGPELGDKTWSALYDNAKVKLIVGPLSRHRQDIDEILRDSVMHAKERLNAPAPAETDEDRLIDRIIAAQDGLRP